MLGTLGVIPAGRFLRAQAQAPAFSTTLQVVNLVATVRDKKGQVITGLGQSDFLLTEDGRPQTIRYFSRETDLPLTLGLLVDTSRSQINLLAEERDASYRFFDKVMREGTDSAFLGHFDLYVEFLKELTSSKAELREPLAQLRVPDPIRPKVRRPWEDPPPPPPGGTHLYSAIFRSADEIMKKQQGRKALIVLTDGVDQGSKDTLESAIESAQRSDTLVYAICFYDPDLYSHALSGSQTAQAVSKAPSGKAILQRISRETGGHYFEVSQRMPLDKVYQALDEELRSQYSIGYTPDSKKVLQSIPPHQAHHQGQVADRAVSRRVLRGRQVTRGRFAASQVKDGHFVAAESARGTGCDPGEPIFARTATEHACAGIFHHRQGGQPLRHRPQQQGAGGERPHAGRFPAR